MTVDLDSNYSNYQWMQKLVISMDNPKVELPVYTRAQLALRNGQDKPQIWVALHGMIYEVTSSRLWRDGKHYEHWAGQDLTHELQDAPHTENVFDKFKPIGRLKDEGAKS